MSELIILIGIGVLGQLLHILFNLRADYKAMLETPDEEDDKNFWRTWRKRNLVDSILSLVIVIGVIAAQYYIIEGGTFLSRQAAFFVGYSLDSAMKKFTDKK